MFDWNSQSASDAPTMSQASEATGILVGCSIATKFGWRPVEAVCLGDLVLTFDHGFRALTGVRRVLLWNGRGVCPTALKPMLIDADVLDNKQDVRVLPDQGIMVESECAEDHRGDPFAVLMPRAMEAFGFADVDTFVAPIEAIILEFEDDEVVYGKSGLHFFVPKAGDMLIDRDPHHAYKVLNTEETFEVLEDLNNTFAHA